MFPGAVVGGNLSLVGPRKIDHGYGVSLRAKDTKNNKSTNRLASPLRFNPTLFIPEVIFGFQINETQTPI